MGLLLCSIASCVASSLLSFAITMTNCTTITVAASGLTLWPHNSSCISKPVLQRQWQGLARDREAATWDPGCHSQKSNPPTMIAMNELELGKEMSGVKIAPNVTMYEM